MITKRFWNNVHQIRGGGQNIGNQNKKSISEQENQTDDTGEPNPTAVTMSVGDLILNVPDEGYSRNAPCALILISTDLLK